MRRAWLVLVLVGCGTPAATHDAGRDAGTDASSDAWRAPPDVYFGDTNASDSGPCATAPTYDDVSRSLFVPSCALAACHSVANPEPTGWLTFDEASSRAQLLGASSFAGALLVIPGDVAHSLLWRKLVDDLPADGTLGQPMPLPGAAGWQPISPEARELVRCWIATGAR